ncbi:MAG TPA: FHA domain-containing protein [Stenomitos sp.]
MKFNSDFSLDRHLLLFNHCSYELISLTAEEYRIGRNPINEIVIEGDPISRLHARLQKAYSSRTHKIQYQIIDGSSDEKPSKNGIFINGVRQQSHILRSGDIISFANIIKALYVQTSLSNLEFERLQSELSLKESSFAAFLERETAISVQANLSELEYTSIMLGGTSSALKNTIY